MTRRYVKWNWCIQLFCCVIYWKTILGMSQDSRLSPKLISHPPASLELLFDTNYTFHWEFRTNEDFTGDIQLTLSHKGQGQIMEYVIVHDTIAASDQALKIPDVIYNNVIDRESVNYTNKHLTLQFHNLKISDSGQLMLDIRTAVGSLHHSVSINVIYKQPVWIEAPSFYTCSEVGSEKTLRFTRTYESCPRASSITVQFKDEVSSESKLILTEDILHKSTSASNSSPSQIALIRDENLVDFKLHFADFQEKNFGEYEITMNFVDSNTTLHKVFRLMDSNHQGRSRRKRSIGSCSGDPYDISDSSTYEDLKPVSRLDVITIECKTDINLKPGQKFLWSTSNARTLEEDIMIEQHFPEKDDQHKLHIRLNTSMDYAETYIHCKDPTTGNVLRTFHVHQLSYRKMFQYENTTTCLLHKEYTTILNCRNTLIPPAYMGSLTWSYTSFDGTQSNTTSLKSGWLKVDQEGIYTCSHPKEADTGKPIELMTFNVRHAGNGGDVHNYSLCQHVQNVYDQHTSEATSPPADRPTSIPLYGVVEELVATTQQWTYTEVEEKLHTKKNAITGLIVVIVILLLLVILFIALFLWEKRKHNKSKRERKQKCHDTSQGADSPARPLNSENGGNGGNV